MKKKGHLIQNKLSWYWYGCAISIVVGLLLTFLALSGIVADSIDENGFLIERGFRTFALGLALIMVGVAVIGIMIIVNALYLRFRKDP